MTDRDFYVLSRPQKLFVVCTADVMSEYFGKRGIQFVTLVGMVMIIFEFVILQIAMAVPVDPISPVLQEAFFDNTRDLCGPLGDGSIPGPRAGGETDPRFCRIVELNGHMVPVQMAPKT